jgi:hypothetical protein
MKNVLILMLTLLISTTYSFSQVNLKNGLVACYPFNGNAIDESGNNNNGTVNGATLTTDRFGKANGAYNFDGSSYILVDGTQFKNQSYTYSTWVYLDNLPAENDQSCFITAGSTVGGDQVLSVTKNYSTFSANGFNGAGYNNSNNPVVSTYWSGSVPNLKKWYHVTVTRDNTSILLYVDGQLIANKSPNPLTNGSSPAYNSTIDVTFGARLNAGNGGGYFQYLQGSLDDIHIYNRAINADEAKALYDGNTPQTITIASNNPTPCGGDKITFTANGATNTSKYQWKVDGVNQGTNSSTFDYTSVKKTGDYSVKISVEVIDEDICFPQKPVTPEQTITIKDCASTGVNLKNGLVACYPFNTNAKDETKNQHDGTVNGATLTSDRFGKASSAYDFDGNSYIQLANPDDFKNNTFTFSAWVNVATVETSSSIFFAGVGIGMTHGTGVLNKLSWAGILYNNEDAPYDQFAHVYTNNNINEWHHLVLVRNATQAKIYVDGVLERTSTTAIPTIPNYVNFPNNPEYIYKATIGTRPNGENIQSFKGVIDDLHIYNRPLNDAEIKALFDGNIISITSNNSAPCGGDNVIFTANGATNTAKYHWKVDGVNQGTNNSTFDYISSNKSSDYQVKITVEVTDDNDVCFPNKTSSADLNITVKNCTPCLVACHPFNVVKTK